MSRVWLAALALVACDTPPEVAGPNATLGATYAAISSDYTSTAISLLDAEGNLVADNYLSSGSAPTGLVTTLSGDVEMPRASGEDGVLVILDRFRADVLTRIRLSDGAILGQVKTHTQTSTSAYSSNPHDYLYLDPSTAYVTRSEPNLSADAPQIDRGNDMFRIDPSTMQRTSDRIDLSALNQQGATGTLYARPSRMVRLGRTVVVGIGRSAFDYRAVGEGVIALVELDSKVVTGFAVPGLKSCSDVQAVPNDDDSVLVSCGGDWTSDPAETAGIALVTVTDGNATIEHQRKSAAANTVALGGTLVGVASNDYTGAGSDVFAVLDLATGSQTVITAITPGRGAFGTPAFDAATGVLLLPDASVDRDKRPTAGLRRFQRSAEGSFRELERVVIAASTALPLRHVFPL